MKEKVQNKINHIRELAKGSTILSNATERKISQSNDSLSKVIRNTQEAVLFCAELNAVISVLNKQ